MHCMGQRSDFLLMNNMLIGEITLLTTRIANHPCVVFCFHLPQNHPSVAKLYR